MSRLYYTAPTDEIFEDMKSGALKIWKQVAQDPRYLSEKTSRVEQIGNIGDNFMYILAMFDINNQRLLVNILREDTKDAVRERLIDGGNEPFYIASMGL